MKNSGMEFFQYCIILCMFCLILFIHFYGNIFYNIDKSRHTSGK